MQNKRFQQLAAWAAAGLVFYFSIYKPEEQRKAQRRDAALVVLDRHATVGKRRRNDPINNRREEQ